MGAKLGTLFSKEYPEFKFDVNRDSGMMHRENMNKKNYPVKKERRAFKKHGRLMGSAPMDKKTRNHVR